MEKKGIDCNQCKGITYTKENKRTVIVFYLSFIQYVQPDIIYDDRRILLMARGFILIVFTLCVLHFRDIALFSFHRSKQMAINNINDYNFCFNLTKSLIDAIIQTENWRIKFSDIFEWMDTFVQIKPL